MIGNDKLTGQGDKSTVAGRTQLYGFSTGQEVISNAESLDYQMPRMSMGSIVL